MGRILALDVGEKTIGVAMSDETRRIALPGETIIRQEGRRRDMAALRTLIAENNVNRIVVGMPLMMDGSRGVQAEKVDAFIAGLRNSARIPIVPVDERLSTSAAERVLRESGTKRSMHKRTVDSMAAALILQSYLAQMQATEPDQIEPDEIEPDQSEPDEEEAP